MKLDERDMLTTQFSGLSMKKRALVPPEDLHEETRPEKKRKSTSRKLLVPRNVKAKVASSVAMFDTLTGLYTPIDLVEAAARVLGLTRLSRKAFLVETVPGSLAGFTCRYPNDADVVDYGTWGGEWVDCIGHEYRGRQRFPLPDGRTELRRVFSSPGDARDHMLCAIILFHDSNNAEKGRSQVVKLINRRNSVLRHGRRDGPLDTLICVTKMHSKDNQKGALFSLFHPEGLVYLVLTTPATPMVVLLSASKFVQHP